MSNLLLEFSNRCGNKWIDADARVVKLESVSRKIKEFRENPPIYL